MKNTLLILLTLVGANEIRGQSTAPVQVYPRITGYFGIVHNLITVDKEKVTPNFKDSYSVGFPTGINLYKTERTGFSFELVPFIVTNSTSSKTDKFLFHPGLLLRQKNGNLLTLRAAFETTGRYGFTPVYTWTLVRRKDYSYYVSGTMPFRFGNQLPASISVGVQIGIAF